MFAISKGLKKREIDEKTELSAVKFQILQNRGWKILLIGLTQAEPFARYEAMVDLGRSLPNIVDTLNDQHTRNEIGDVLINCTVSDERAENRIKALYLLGQFSLVLGHLSECHPMLSKIFKHLARLLLNIQAMKTELSPKADTRLHLIRAIAKFANFKISNNNQVEHLVVLMAYKELMKITEEKRELNSLNPNLFVLLSILDLLNSNVEITDLSKSYIGALFQKSIYPMLHSPHAELKRSAIQFISNWLPIQNEDALLVGYDNLIDGIKYSRIIGYQNFNENDFNIELRNLQEKIHLEECRVSLREKIIRSIIQPPGTVAHLLPVPGCTGFFCDSSSGMRKTKSILVDLPVHGKSNVTLTRLIPQIPGVPSCVTTTPPLYMVGEKWSESRPPPDSQYEYCERIGAIPSLPPLFTYNPNSQNITRDSKKPETPPNTLVVARNPTKWKEVDDLPKGTSRIPIRNDTELESASGSAPVGFNIICPYPGFDPDKIDRTVSYISAIYGKPIQWKSSNQNNQRAVLSQSADKYFYQDYSCVGTLEETPKLQSIDEGATFNRHPSLFPCKLHGLKSGESSTDFPIGAPVLFDILQPQSPKLHRILTIVENVESEASNIVVQKGANDIGGLYNGAIFNVYVRTREQPNKWIAIQLKVIDEDYDDGLDLGVANQTQPWKSKRESLAKREASFISSTTEIFSHPMPTQYTSTGEPYFPPPVTMPMYPVGYNDKRFPYFGKSPAIKPIPLGMTPKGSRYYSEKHKESTDSGFKNQIAGYDCDGQPFFIPRGFTLPSPSGYTIDGIPYYDVPTLIRQPGIMAFPTAFRDINRLPVDGDSWEDLVILLQKPSANAVMQKKSETALRTKLAKHLSDSQPVVFKKILSSHNRVMNPNQNKAGVVLNNNFTPPDDRSLVEDPENISEFLADGLAFSHLKPQPIRIVTEPAHCDFHSARAPTTKTIALRHKSGRGDHTEREFFVAVEPPNIFSIKEFNFKLQGEGVHEILVTFYPLSMKSSTCEGGLHVFDKYGRKMATSKLTAIKKKFFKVSPTQMDIGWVLPGRKKELSVVIENLAEYQINVSMILGSKPNSSENTAEVKKYSGFRLEFDTIKLRPLETSKIPIIFNPKLPGRALETCIFRGPGGEEVLIQLVGTTDIPLAIYPENEENSKLGITALSIERTQLIRKIDKAGTDDIAASGLSKFEANVMELITRSQTDTKKNAPVLDFGICVPENVQTTRILTVMNWGDEPITCSLYSYDKAVTCPYLVRIAPRSASSVEVVLTYNGIKHHIRGNYTSVLEIACKGFDNMSVSILAFIGQAVYLPIYEYAFFKPCRIGQSSSFQTHIMNESQYDIKGAITGLEEVDGVISDIQCSPGFEKGETTFVVPAYSLIPVNFYYKPQFSGPSIKRIQIQIISPGNSLVNATMKGAELFLIGSCIQPKSDSSKGKVTPIVEKLIQWVSNLRNIKGGVTEDGWVDPDASNPISISADDLYEVVFKVDPFVPEIPGDFGSSSQVLSVQNRGSVTRKVKFFASAGFTVDPKGKELEPGELLKLDYFFNPPPNIGTMVTVFGFAAALDQMNGLFSATQLVKRLSLGLLLLPFQCYIDQQIVLDFGRVEITSECNSDCTRYLILCNPFFVRYNWSIKVAPSARKTLAFEMPFTKGTLPKSETFAVPFRLKTDVSGTFETKCEVFLDPNDPYSKSIRLGTILLKGIAVFTQLTGLPESIDFGSTIVHHSTKKKLNLQNEGSQEMEVNVLLRAPFSISPPKFTIPAKSNQVVEVSFNPTEHRLASTIMQIFANQNLYCVKVSGVGGTALLVCEDYSEKPLDFGLHQDGLIVSTNIQFFNKGSIPLKLKAVVSDNPSRIRVEFLGITNSSSHEAPKFDIRKDYWRTVRRKIKVFRFLFSNQKPIPSKKYGSRANTVQRDPIRKYIPVEDVLEVDPVTSSVQVPDLPALSSYNFRISYIITYHTSNLQSELSLTYVPICDESESVAVENLLESTTIELLASAFVPLDIHPSTLSFGYCPTETGAISKISQTDNANNYGVTSLTSNNNFVSYLPIKVSNPGNNVQNLILDTISPEFFIQGKTWAIAPKEVIEIPVEFHPSREQTHYIGEAKFTHKYGSVSVVLNGVGASAEIVADEILDFGNLKLDTKLSKNLTIHNRGILDCSYEIEIVQSSSTFYLVDEEDPYESYGNVKSGLSVIKRIECLSKKKDGMEGHICIRWKKVPNGIQEKTIVPLRVSTGYPDFKMQLTELDFKVVYLDINRTIDFKISNNGNAVCNWKAICDHPTLSLNVDEGIIESGETIILKITFKPVEYEILDSSITFQTDSGTIKLICFGVVGVPFLKIFRDSRDIDFGVVTVGQQHHTFVDIANTGAIPIDYEIQWIYMSKNQKPCKLHEFDFFFVEPNSGRILPNDILSLKVSLLPKEYATVYQASFIIRTKAGEEHTVKIRGVGGQAIIKIKPPTVTNNYARPIATPETDDKEVKRNFQRSKDESETGSRIPNLPTKSFEANRHLFKAHVNNLHEILAGLRAAEMEISPEQVDETPNPTRRRYQLEKREDVADIPESTKFFMEYLNEMEKELDEAIGKLDPTGAYSLDLSSSRPRSTITPDTSTPLNPTPPSQKSSRSFGSYNPGHRMHRSSRGTQSLVTTPREKSSSKTPDEHIDDLSQKRADYDKMSRGSRVSSRQYQIMEDTMELDEFTTSTKSAGASKSPSKADQDSTRKREKKSRHLSEKTTQHRNSTMVIRESSGVDLVEDVIEDSSNVNLDVPYVDESISASKLDSTQRIDMDGKDKSTQQIDIDVKEIQVGEDIQGSKSMLIDSLNPNEALNEVNDENLSESFKSMVLFDVKEQKTEVERIIEIGQKLGLTLEMAEGDMYQIKQLNQMVSNFMVSTRSTIRTVKEQLIHETWVPNRELLQQALRKLEMSAVAIQDMFIDNQKDSGKSIEDECPTYPLSLISGGERTSN
ncbi:hypothetical protein BC833DRAFT_375645 [Globomyces pollinis-pini]|nr:hypothetical protein BC833DRAFT_375645 [Globomyces pollinis-pini]